MVFLQMTKLFGEDPIFYLAAVILPPCRPLPKFCPAFSNRRQQKPTRVGELCISWERERAEKTAQREDILEEQRVIGADKGRVTGNTCCKTNQEKEQKRVGNGKREAEEKKATWRKERGYCIVGRGKKEERKKRKKGKMEPHPCQTRRRFVLPSPSDIFFFLSFPVSHLTCIKLDVCLVLFLLVSIDIGRWLSLFIII